MYGKADEGVDLLPLGQVRVIEYAGRQVDYLGVRAVRTWGQAKSHPERRVHCDDIVACHAVGLLDDIPCPPAVSKQVRVVSASGDERLPSEAAAAADLHVCILVAVEEVASEGIHLLFSCKCHGLISVLRMSCKLRLFHPPFEFLQRTAESCAPWPQGRSIRPLPFVQPRGSHG